MLETLIIGLTTALGTPGAVLVLATAFLAGIVYGFAGFGAALVFMPIATIFVSPVLAVAAFSVSALVSFVTVVPRAWRECEKVPVFQLIFASLVLMPFGLYALRTWDISLLRWLVLAVTSITLVSLIAGWRRSAGDTGWARTAVGGAAGLVGGATGLVGPIVVLFQLSSKDGPARSRANTLVFLTLTSIATLPLMFVQGMLRADAVWLGLLLLIPYGGGTLLGQALFHPEREVLYRTVAYGVIALAIVIGLPVWDTI